MLLSDDLAPADVPTLDDIVLADTFELPAYDDDWALFCKDFAETVAGRIRTLEPDVVVVRRADMGPKPSNQDGPRIRLVASGAVTAAAKILVPKTFLRTGKACADAYGERKDKLDEDGARLVPKSNLKEAAAAALSGLVADRSA